MTLTEQNKRSLAKWLPDDIQYVTADMDIGAEPELWWKDGDDEYTCGREVLPTELEHLVWLVEEKLTEDDQHNYWFALNDYFVKTKGCASYFDVVHATPTQRIAALEQIL